MWAVHFCDLVWFIVAWLFFYPHTPVPSEKALRKMFLRFIFIDIATMILIAAVLLFTDNKPFLGLVPPITLLHGVLPEHALEIFGLVALGLIAVCDFAWNSVFLLHGIDAFEKSQENPAQHNPT
jgi:hypothetical protein